MQSVSISAGFAKDRLVFIRIIHFTWAIFLSPERSEGSLPIQKPVILSEGGLPRAFTSAANPSRRILGLFFLSLTPPRLRVSAVNYLLRPRAIAARASASAVLRRSVSRLSQSCLPRATASSHLALPPLK